MERQGLKIVTAMDSFKGSMTSMEAGNAVAEGVKRVFPAAELAREKYAGADPEYPGSGAAGGMGFAFLAFTNAELKPGISLVLQETGLEGEIRDADLVITGEGRLDAQTAMGKAPVGVAKLAKKYAKTVIAFAGGVTPEAVSCNAHGIDAFFPIVRGVTALEEAMRTENAAKNLADTVEQVMRLMNALR